MALIVKNGVAFAAHNCARCGTKCNVTKVLCPNCENSDRAKALRTYLRSK